MNFADKYFEKYNSYNEFLNEKPENNLGISVVIPCYNETGLLQTFESLMNCELPKKSVEIITVINSSSNTLPEIIEVNKRTLSQAKEFAHKHNSSKIKFYFIELNNIEPKTAGVGNARKAGMDEALRRFNYLNKPDGIITGMDADTSVERNYFVEIENFFNQNPKTSACSIFFEHPVEGTQFSGEIYQNIIKYELHLRYFISSLKKIKHPHAFQTIGSSFAVKAEIYAKQGGMNRKKAGEDFYFLQKIIAVGNYSELNSTTVYPSPRISDRVPFGTGAAIKKLVESRQKQYFTYNNTAFDDLEILFENKFSFYKNFDTKKIPQIIISFLEANNFNADVVKINQNSPNKNIFEKRFFDWFNLFRVIKFLNSTHENYYSKIPVGEAAANLLKKIDADFNTEIDEKNLLLTYRKIDKKLY